MVSYLPPINVLANTTGKIALTDAIDFYGRDNIGDKATGQYINTLGGNDETWLYSSNMVVDHGNGDDSAWARFYNYAGNAVTNAAYIGGSGNDDLTLVASASDFMSGLYKLSAVNDATYGLMYQVTDNNNNKIYFSDFEQIKLSGSGSSYTLNDFVNTFLNKSPIAAPTPPAPPVTPPVQPPPTTYVPIEPPCLPPVVYDTPAEIKPPSLYCPPNDHVVDFNHDDSLDELYSPVPYQNRSFGPLQVKSKCNDLQPPYPIPHTPNTNSRQNCAPRNTECHSNYGGFQSLLPMLTSLLSGYLQAPQARSPYSPVFNFNFNFGTNTNYFAPTRSIPNALLSIAPWF